MAIFYSDTGSFSYLQVQGGTGSGLFTVSGSQGGLFQVNDLVSTELFAVASGSTDVLTISTASVVNIYGDLKVSNSITGSLFGNATTATEAVYAVNAGFADSSTSASYASTASFLSGNVTSASFASTASFLSGNVTTASYASTASFLSGNVTTASYASTASYIVTAQTASYYGGSVTSASYASSSTSASFASTASYWSGSIINAASASFASTASFVTGSIYTGGNIAASASYAVFADTANIVVAAGGSTNSVSQLVFSNANNVSFGLAGSTITATAAAGGAVVESYYQNIPQFVNTTTYSNANSTFTGGGTLNFIQPFVLPYDISVGFFRFFASNTWISSTFASTANQTYTYNQSNTFWANIYTQGTGASSRSLRQYAQASATMAYQVIAQIGAASSNQTATYNLTYPFESGSLNFTTQTNPGTAASFVFLTTPLASFSGNKFLDLPFNSSLPAGAYWLAFQKSTATATTGGQLTGISNGQFLYQVTQINSGFAPYASNTSAVTNQLEPGLGVVAVTNVGGTTNSVALSSVSSQASNPKIPFQIIRFA